MYCKTCEKYTIESTTDGECSFCKMTRTIVKGNGWAEELYSGKIISKIKPYTYDFNGELLNN